MRRITLILLAALAFLTLQAEVADIPTPEYVVNQSLVVNAAKSVVNSQQCPLSLRWSIVGWRFLDDFCTLEMFYEFDPTVGNPIANPQTMSFYKVTTDSGWKWIYKTDSWHTLNVSGQLPLKPKGN